MKIWRLPFIIIVLIVFLALMAIGLISAVTILNSPHQDITEEGVLFSIKKGESTESIISRLEQQKLIRSGLLLRIITKIYQTERSFKSGVYRITPELTTLDIHNLLVSGNQDLLRITIPEGWTRSRIAAALEQEGLATSEDFLQATEASELLKKYAIPASNAEGYLFPDTYLLPREISALNIAQMMVNTFFIKLNDLYPSYINLSALELHKKIILASIVEREYRQEEEAPLIASVFYNRLNKNIKLESCATIGFIKTEILGQPHAERLWDIDLQIPSPYNTYQNYGLPPGPISNPGTVALSAVFSPADTTYLYFVLEDRNTGKHHFSVNFTEHVSAKNYFLKY
jgi:UPF0755 protein